MPTQLIDLGVPTPVLSGVVYALPEGAGIIHSDNPLEVALTINGPWTAKSNINTAAAFVRCSTNTILTVNLSKVTSGASAVIPPALTYQQQVLADGASAYWPMNDASSPITDLAGSRNITSITGSPTYGVAGPRSLTAMSFSRTASAIPPSSVPVGISFTLEAWIRRTAIYPRAFIMARNLTAQNDWYLAFNTSSGDRLQFVYRDASVSNTLFFPMTFPLNTWTHIVLVITGTVVQLYVNGVAAGSSQALLTLGGLGSGAFQLASTSGAPSEAWGGQLADLAIYPLVLSEAKILAHSTAL